ncbi:MAG: bifunctional transaldolase/phosoglucose isomerase [Candidatus Latescibacterota bacterium]|nr:MAG: bifunctional transaldolase/phosoglucose isomerase [Candidatus Latescibacterota bacterium]
MNPLKRLYDEGQSIWLDFIRRSLITSGELNRLIEEDGVSGMTSNPSIFEKAIAGSADYDESLRSALDKNPHQEIEELCEKLVVEDIQMAADVLRPIYDETGGADGYVSVEVSPKLADDRDGTISEAERLWKTVARPNIMIKVPATDAGVPALEDLTAKGVNVNATLMFSLKHYEAIAQAYIRGLKRCEQPGDVASVASFFVSRVDTAVDKALEAVGKQEALELRGKIAVANSKLTYQRFKEIFSGEEFKKLAAKGARVQRPLWASTSTKNPDYRDVLYVEELIGPDTVNTLPPATLNAFRDHGRVEPTLTQDLGKAEAQVAKIERLGVDLGAITDKLQVDGVAAFAKSYDELLEALKKKRSATLSGRLARQYFSLGASEDRVRSRLREWEKTSFTSRLWQKDPTLWSDPPLPELENRLGWLSLPREMHDCVDVLDRFVNAVRKDEFQHVVLLGMGGSSLAPEVYQATFGNRKGYPALIVLDSTHPGAVQNVEATIDVERTLFIVASKSGTTIETLSFFNYFWDKVRAVSEKPGRQFVAITDPGTPLESIAGERVFREVFHAPVDVGGRFSALSEFGLVPAALIGVDVHKVLDGSWAMMDSSVARASGEDNPALRLGAALGELANAGRDKLTLVTSPSLSAFPGWIEQLVAESTGKDGKGILPIVDEPLGPPEIYGDDRCFVDISLVGDASVAADQLSVLERAEHPVGRIQIKDRSLLGQEFFRWEVAVAAAGSILGIHPFNQPDVQLAKDLTKKMISQSGETTARSWTDGIDTLRVDDTKTLASGVDRWLESSEPRDYLGIHAYLVPTDTTTAALQEFRVALRNRTCLATTLGYGPRFLHSTGQLHKGGPNNGLFLQIVDEPTDLLDIPGAEHSFGELIRAQALGDAGALQQRGRRIIRINLGRSGVDKLQDLTKLMQR